MSKAPEHTCSSIIQSFTLSKHQFKLKEQEKKLKIAIEDIKTRKKNKEKN